VNNFTDEDLNSAVSEGIFSESDVELFRGFLAQRSKSISADDEHFRLVSGFNDIFVVIACSLLLVSIGHFGDAFGGGLVALSSWLLAEYFTRKRGLALPSIILLCSFVGGAFVQIVSLDLVANESLNFAIGSGLASFLAWFHWRRFRVPITVAAGTISLVCLCAFLYLSSFPDKQQWLELFLFIMGLAVFSLAMWWDMSDRLRQTKRSDVAFWLHLTAAPLVVHPIFSALDVYNTSANAYSAVIVGVVFILLAVASIVVDRRSLMVSSLAYVLYAFAELLEEKGLANSSFAIVSFCIGGGLLVLSAFWATCRKKVLAKAPAFVTDRVPPYR